MKDEEARERIGDLERAQRNYLGFHIRGCPECGHETPQIEGDGCIKGSIFVYGLRSYSHRDYDYLCLVCGSKLQCGNKCEVIKEKK